MRSFYTIGHSSHPADRFLALLRANNVEVLVDTRSAPYSRYSPHFDREPVRDLMHAAGIKYLYLGDVVGGRPKDGTHYDERGRALYGKMRKDDEFLGGIARLERGADEFRVALMCSEEDPSHCHRRLLIGRVLIERGAQLLHIRGDGEIQLEWQVVASSGKALVEVQPALFAELDEDKWEIFSIGFTQKSAAQFFGALKGAGIRRLVDVRLNNRSQLAGFTKCSDLPFLLQELCGASYVHEPLLAPTQEMLDEYKKNRGSWSSYEERFLALMSDRDISNRLDPASFEEATVLLCSEPTAEQCHRRLVLEYLQRHWDGVIIRHL